MVHTLYVMVFISATAYAMYCSGAFGPFAIGNYICKDLLYAKDTLI